MAGHNPLDLELLCLAGLHATRTVLKQIVHRAFWDPEVAFQEIELPKKAIRVDLEAESSFFEIIRRHERGTFRAIRAFGEERSSRLGGAPGLQALLDPIDGSDLLQRDLSNWCTAALFADSGRPRGHRIVASFIGLATPRASRSISCNTRIYYASDERDGAWVKRDNMQSSPVAGPSRVTSLGGASLCFYGQKLSRLISLGGGRLAHYVNALGSSAGSFRIYNLGGNPMMAKLVDCRVATSRWIDAVIEIGKGQQPHDVLPGAYIAKKGGASIKGPDGSDITYEMLENALFSPAARFEYVVASTPELAAEITANCRWSEGEPPRRRKEDLQVGRAVS